MATLNITPTGEYQVQTGDTLSRIASSQGRTLAELLSQNPQFARNPNLIHPGDVVKFGNNAQPSYQGLQGGVQNQQPQPQAPMGLNEILTQMFKGAQKQYTGNQAALLGGQEAIDKTSAETYSGDLANANITNEARLSLLGQADNLQNPALRSIESQQKMNESRYNSTNDMIKSTQDAYDKEQNRIAQAQSDLADAQYKAQMLAETIRSNKASEGIAAQKASGSGAGGGGGIYDQLDYRTANAVIAQGNQFGTSDVVKKYNNIVAASNLIRGVDPFTKNPAEHQAVIYNFAKALDPESVVREGEYATVKKYSQSLINKYGGEIRQAIAGKGFLSAGAIKAIQEATDNRIKAYEPQYTNLKNQTANRINALAGQNIADMVLLDYEQGYSGNQEDPQVQEMLDAGYSQAQIQQILNQ